MQFNLIKRPVIFGVLSAALLLSFYFLILSFISGWGFTIEQFKDNWYWIVSLSAGFGIQIGLFTYIRALHKITVSGGVVAVSGTTSTFAMVSCCAHYLVNILPVIGISGIAAIIGQYQTELFWLGLASNAFGIGYLVRKLIKLKGYETYTPRT